MKRPHGGQVAVLGLALAALVAAVGVQARFGHDRPDPTGADAAAHRVFAAVRRFAPAGWTVNEYPLGATEFMEKVVEKKLQFDDALFRVYRQGSTEFGLYIAYWSPGRKSLREVDTHTPDTCWVNNGWRMEDRSSGFCGFASGTKVAAGQYRRFSANGEIQYVAFWHMLGGDSIDIQYRGLPTPSYLWKLALGDGPSIRSEQYFIRLSCSRPLDEVWGDPALKELLNVLRQTGLSGPRLGARLP